ncbi:hypothetical protein C5167_035923 [Papaver somniferum]|nr:hypothetical protein C5167_035923 [Papaver somniferum]
MTINKSQGQSIDNVGIYLPNPIFNHGQLYVAVSRTTSRNGLKILIDKSKDIVPEGYTQNVVYREIFKNLQQKQKRSMMQEKTPVINQLGKKQNNDEEINESNDEGQKTDDEMPMLAEDSDTEMSMLVENSDDEMSLLIKDIDDDE